MESEVLLGFQRKDPLRVAKLPRGYEGQFGPGVKAISLAFYFGMGTSELKILEFLENPGLIISKGQLSNLLIEGQEVFHAESDAVYEGDAHVYHRLDCTRLREFVTFT